MGLDAVRIRPPRCTLVNLTTGEELMCVANPTELAETISVNWNRLAVPGLSHQVLQFSSTGNRQLAGVELYLDRFLAAEDPQAPDILQFRSFLLALTVPQKAEAAAAPAAPPRVLFVWPQLLAMECVIESIELRYQRFAVDSSVLVYTATVTFEEILDIRVTSAERRGG
jgi:contractile injection system tube protein